MNNPIEFCEHDSLKRSCPICDLQEELKEERRLRLQAEQGLHACWEMVKERGKELSEARKERLDYQSWVVEGMRQDAQQVEQERNDWALWAESANQQIDELRDWNAALLECLKWYADDDKYQRHRVDAEFGFTDIEEPTILNDAGSRARFIISKLEGSKPNDTPTT